MLTLALGLPAAFALSLLRFVIVSALVLSTMILATAAVPVVVLSTALVVVVLVLSV